MWLLQLAKKLMEMHQQQLMEPLQYCKLMEVKQESRHLVNGISMLVGLADRVE